MKKKLKHIANIINSPCPSFENTKLYFSTGAVKGNDTPEIITFEDRPSRANVVVKENDILIAKMKGANKTTIATKEMEEHVYSTGFSVIRNNENILTKYLYYLLLNHDFTLMKDLLSNGTTQESITDQNLKNIELEYIEDITEQQKIVDFLDNKVTNIDDLINKTKNSIKLYEEYKESLITKMVTDNISTENCKLKYLVDKIGDIDHYMPETKNFGFPYVMTGDLKPIASKIDFANCKKISEMDYIELAKKIKPQLGDVILARYATIGTICYVDINTNFLVSYSCVTIKPNNKLNGKYLYYFFKSYTFQEEIKKHINTNTQSNLGLESLNNIKIPIPSKEKQLQIVNLLDKKCTEIDLLIEKKKTLINQLEEYKKSLIYEYVTGKKQLN